MTARVVTSEAMLNDAAVRGVVRLSRQVEIALAEFQLSLSQFRLLDRLVGGNAAGRSLAEWLAVKPPSITALVDGLVVRGLVARGADANDRRRVSHSLTAEGRRLYDDASRALATRLGQLVEQLGDASRAHEMVIALAGWNDALDLARERRAEQPAT
jgi:DNA-binding MarR family transcriptional regulator